MTCVTRHHSKQKFAIPITIPLINHVTHPIHPIQTKHKHPLPFPFIKTHSQLSIHQFRESHLISPHISHPHSSQTITSSLSCKTLKKNVKQLKLQNNNPSTTKKKSKTHNQNPHKPNIFFSSPPCNITPHSTTLLTVLIKNTHHQHS